MAHHECDVVGYTSGKEGKKAVVTPSKTDKKKGDKNKGKMKSEDGTVFITTIKKKKAGKRVEGVLQAVTAMDETELELELDWDDFQGKLERQDAISALISITSRKAHKHPSKPKSLDLKTIAATAQFQQVGYLLTGFRVLAHICATFSISFM